MVCNLLKKIGLKHGAWHWGVLALVLLFAVVVPGAFAASPTAIYRSVGPGATSAIDDDDSNNHRITISGSTATFSTVAGPLDVENNVGVGDVILYDTGGTDNVLDSSDSIAFIHGRTDGHTFTVATDTGGTPTSTTSNDTWEIYRAYTSLSDAESGTENATLGAVGYGFTYAGGNRDIDTNNEVWNIACYANGTTADSTKVAIDGWTTDSDNYINIYTPTSTSEVGTTQRHSGKWDNTKYRLEVANTDIIAIVVPYVRVDGLQIYVTASDNYDSCISASLDGAASDIRISNNVLWGEWSGYSNSQGINLMHSASGSSTGYIWNNILYDIDDGNKAIFVYTSWTAYIYNNTIVDSSYGIYSAGGTVIAKNNIVHSCTDDYYGTFSSSSDYNLGEDAAFSGDDNYVVTEQTAAQMFVAPTASPPDFHILSTSDAKDAGTDQVSEIGFSDDIDGHTRPVGDDWDIGADEYSIDNGLVLHQTFDTAMISGSTALDSTDYHNDGTIDGATGDTGILDEALSFDGGNDSVDVNHHSSLNFHKTDPFSAFLWMKSSSGGSYEPLLNKFGSSYRGYFMQRGSGSGTGDLAVGLVNSWSSSDIFVYVSTTINDGAWHFVGFTYDGSGAAAGVDLYVDGQLENKTISRDGLGANDIDNTASLIIGREFTDEYYTGISDDVRIYSRALSATEVAALYAQGAPPQIYRSVGPSATTALAEHDSATTGGTLTISGTSATFTITGSAGELPNNVGVGDAIEYDSTGNSSIDSIAFISARTDNEHYTVQSASGGDPTEVTNSSTWHVFRAYTSLSKAESGDENDSLDDNVETFESWSDGKDLTSSNEVWNIACYANGTTADTTAVTIADWTTASGNYLKIYTPTETTEVGTTQRHSGKWVNTKYKLEPTSGDAIRLDEDHIRIDGLQIASKGYGIYLRDDYLNPGTANGFKFSNNIIKYVGTGSHSGIHDYSCGTWYAQYWNNIIYDFPGYGMGGHNNKEIYCYNNTIINCGYGFKRNEAVIVVKNNIVINCTDGFNGTFSTSSDYNISNTSQEDADSANATFDGYKTVTFVDDTGSPPDFHLAPNDTSAKDEGTTLNPDPDGYLSFSDDIDGHTRPVGSAWDIGADEYSIDNGLVLHQTFDTAMISGSTALDSTDYHNDGTITGATGDTGILNEALSFDGSDDGVRISASSSYKPDNITINVWIKSTETGSIDSWEKAVSLPYTTGWSDPYVSYSIGRHNTAQYTDFCVTVGGTDYIANDTSGTEWSDGATEGEWFYVTLTYDGETLRGYIDGLEVASNATPSGNIDYSGGTTDLALGRRTFHSSPGEYLKGLIDDVRIYNRALSATEVAALYAQGPATQIYRSVGPSATTALAEHDSATTGGTLTISGTTATFTITGTAGELPNNVGVGDAIEYDSTGNSSIDSIAFISARTDNEHYTVQSASGGDPTEVTNSSTWHVFRAYTSLSKAESGDENDSLDDNVEAFESWSNGQDITSATGSNEVWNIACYANGTTADSTAVEIDDWTTGEDNYIKVYTPTATSEVGTTQRHSGVWDDSKYRLEASITGNLLYVLEENVRIEGLQMSMTASSGGPNPIRVAPSGTPDVRINSSVFRGILSGTVDSAEGIVVSGESGTVRVWNNIVYDFDMSGCSGIQLNSDTTTMYAYNNTVYNCNMGFRKVGTGTYVAKNNIAQDCTDGYAGAFDSSSDYNISDVSDTDAPNATFTDDYVSVYFLDEANRDLRLAYNDTGAKNLGVDLNPDPDGYLTITDDIAGNTRPNGAGTWDIGAHEATQNASPVNIYRSVGPSDTSDLNTGSETVTISGTTATVSGDGFPKNVGVGDVLQYQAGGAYHVAFIHGRTSATVYTVADTAGGTPYPASAGTAVNVYRAYTTLDNAEGGVENTALNDAVEDFDTWDADDGKNITLSNEVWNIACYANGTTADSTGVGIGGWTTDSDNYIKIYTPTSTSEVGTTQRHSGRWDTTKWRLESGLSIGEDYVKLDGLQIQVTGTSGNRSAIEISTLTASDNKIEISNGIFKGVLSDTGNARGIYSTSANNNTYFWNNIVQDWTLSGTFAMRILGTAAYVYNNTFVNCTTGIYANTADIVVAKNNIFYSNTAPATGTFAAGTDYNATDDDSIGYSVTGEGNTHDQTSQTFTFVDETNHDFHLAADDTGAKSLGVDLNPDPDGYLTITDDIDGHTRLVGSTWDIGADEYSIDNGLVLHQTFDTAMISGSTALDSTDYHNDGTIDGATGDTGILNQALSFNGSSDYIHGGDVLDMGTNDMTITAWVKTNTTSSVSQFIVSKSYYGSGNYRYGVKVPANDSSVGIFMQGNGGADVEFDGNITVVDGNWHFLTFVYDRDANATIYVDGTYDTAQAISQWDSVNMNSSYPFRIGSYTASNGVDPYRYFDGLIDDVRIYNRALSASEIEVLHAQGAAYVPRGPGAVGYPGIF